MPHGSLHGDAARARCGRTRFWGQERFSAAFGDKMVAARAEHPACAKTLLRQVDGREQSGRLPGRKIALPGFLVVDSKSGGLRHPAVIRLARALRRHSRTSDLRV